jgi:HAD superfamily hydrolase (TIGR01490 family)
VFSNNDEPMLVNAVGPNYLHSMSDAPKVAVFFDFDHTLIDVNSGLLFAKYERRQGRASLFMLLRVAFWMLLYRLSIIDMEKAYRHALNHYKGDTDAAMASRARDWFSAEVATRLQPGARVALEYHREEAHLGAVLTTSSCYVARCAAEAYKLDVGIGNSFSLDAEDRLDGGFNQPLCYGSGKIEWARRWAEPHGISIEDCYFYTDSYSDLPMLEVVAHPRVVNPDFRLRRVARKRGWPILDWRTDRLAIPERSVQAD